MKREGDRVIGRDDRDRKKSKKKGIDWRIEIDSIE